MGLQSQDNVLIAVKDGSGSPDESLPGGGRNQYFAQMESSKESPKVPVSNVSPALTGASVQVLGPGSPGSGTLIEDPVVNSDGSTTYFVLTAGHVVDGAQKGEEVYIETADGQLYSVSAGYKDPNSDVAVLMLTVPKGTPPLITTQVTPTSGTDPETLVATAPIIANQKEIISEGGDAVTWQKNSTYTFNDNIVTRTVSPATISGTQKQFGSTVEPISPVAGEAGSSGGAYYNDKGELMGVHVGASHGVDPSLTESTKVPGGVDVNHVSLYVPVTQQQVTNLINQVRAGGGAVTKYKS